MRTDGHASGSLGATFRVWRRQKDEVSVHAGLRESFRPVHPDDAPRFRVIDAPAYLARFASDRSHMIGPEGVPLKPFPDWPRIGEGMNLQRFVDMGTPFFGEVVDLDTLQRLRIRPGSRLD